MMSRNVVKELEVELKELQGRYLRLQEFIGSNPIYLKVGKVQQSLLNRQRCAIREYCRCLEMRIADLVGQEYVDNLNGNN